MPETVKNSSVKPATRNNPRTYNCKDEELPFIGDNLLTSLQRDRDLFDAYSPAFSEKNIETLADLIASARQLVNPIDETILRKQITAQLYTDIENARQHALQLEGYLLMSQLPVSAKDFGLTALKQHAAARNAEGAVQQLHTVISHIDQNKAALAAHGLTDNAIKQLTDIEQSIIRLNRRQYQVTTSRKATVRANISIMNTLYAKIKEISIIGKIIFRNNPDLLKEYTFTHLKKSVRLIIAGK